MKYARSKGNVCVDLIFFYRHTLSSVGGYLQKHLPLPITCVHILPFKSPLSLSLSLPPLPSRLHQVLQAAATSCQEAQLAGGSIATQISVQLDPLDGLTTYNTSPGGTTSGPKPAAPPPGRGTIHTHANMLHCEMFTRGKPTVLIHLSFMAQVSNFDLSVPNH